MAGEAGKLCALKCITFLCQLISVFVWHQISQLKGRHTASTEYQLQCWIQMRSEMEACTLDDIT